jgi:hypothetical protein
MFPIKYLKLLKSLWQHPRYFDLYGAREITICTFYKVPLAFPNLSLNRFLSAKRARTASRSSSMKPVSRLCPKPRDIYAHSAQCDARLLELTGKYRQSIPSRAQQPPVSDRRHRYRTSGW